MNRKSVGRRMARTFDYLEQSVEVREDAVVSEMKLLHMEERQRNQSSNESGIDTGGAANPSAHTKTEESLSVEAEGLVMPEKVGQRKLVAATVIDVQSNLYEIQLGETALGVYRYDVDIVVPLPRAEKSLAKGPINDYARLKRQTDCWNVMQYVMERETKDFGDKYRLIYDRQATLYWLQTHQQAINKKNGMSFTVKATEEEQSDLLRGVFPKQADFLVIKIKPADQAHLIVGDFSACVTADLVDRDRTVQQFLELVTSQALFDEKNHIVFGNKAIWTAGWTQDLGGGKFLATGFEKNVRFVGNSEITALPVIQIDTKKTAFFSSMLVSDFVSHHLKVPVDKFCSVPLADKQRSSIHSQLKDLAVVSHSGHEFVVYGLTKTAVVDTHIDIYGRKVSVYDYFAKKHGMRLKYRMLPCVVERRPGRDDSFHPMEMVKLQPNQRVEMCKQTPEQVEKMIRHCATIPPTRVHENEKHRLAARLGVQNPFLERMKINVCQQPLVAKGTVLDAPTIRYGNGKKVTVEAGKGDWKTPHGTRFLRPAVVDTWVAVLTQNGANRIAEAFVNMFVAKCQSLGMRMGPPSAMFLCVDRTKLDEMFAQSVVQSVRFVLFLTPSKGESCHDYAKLQETQTGLVTQDVRISTAERCLSGGGDLIVENIVKKTNLKLAGLNFQLETAPNMLRRNNLSDDIIKNEWLSNQKMFVGIDVCHPPPLTASARRRGEELKEPSVVGLCSNSGPSALDYTGVYWFQASRKESVVDELDVHIANQTRLFKENRGFLPDSVVVYRDGVSEGQFAMVMRAEQQQIRQGLCMGADDENYRPKLSIIVVQKRTNYRLMPAKFPRGARKPVDMNLPPGTVVHTDLVHPTYEEFLITPHRAIQGTAKPIRCTVVVDDLPRTTRDELEGTMYALCYCHEIVNSPTSLPAPVVAAHELAKRGKNNFRVSGGAEGSSSSGNGTQRSSVSASSIDEVFEKKSTELDIYKHTHLKTSKFWA